MKRVSELFVIATPIGNLSDIAPRALGILAGCDLILCEDTRHTLKLLTHFDIHRPLVSYHEHNESARSAEIVRQMTEREMKVALVSDAGTPCISDPGHAVVAAARAAGVRVTGVSGPSALITALSVAGFEIPSFSFHGFAPRERKEREALLKAILAEPEPVFALYESPKRVRALLSDLAGAFPEAAACVCCDLTKLHEKTICGPITEMRDALYENPNAELGEYVVIIRKNAPAMTEETRISPHALLVDYMVRHPGTTLKDAVSALKAEGLNKNELYDATLAIKSMRW